jgi:hypothetical protein
MTKKEQTFLEKYFSHLKETQENLNKIYLKRQKVK